MFCRRALQRVGPLARWLLRPISKSTAPVRHMALGVPGGSTNLAYVVLCGGGLTAAVVYAYKTVNGDTERYEDRLANMRSEEKAEVTSEAASSLPAESAPAEDEPAPGAEITPEPVPASPEPAAETSAEPTAEASPEEPAAAEASEADVAEAPAEPADAEGAPVAVEETAAEVGSEVAAVTPAEDTAAAEESAAEQALGEESLGKALHQMEDDGKDLKEDLQQHPLETTVEMSVEAAVYIEEQLFEVEEVPHGLTIEELSADRIPAADAEQEEEEKERAVSLPEEIAEAEENTAIPDSPSEETGSSPEDSSSSGEASSDDEEEAVVTAEATPEEEETKSEQPHLRSVGETTQLAAASTEPSLEVLSNTEPEPPSPVAPADKEEPCHSCHFSPSSSKEAAPPAALGEDLLDMDVAQEAKESFDKPLAKQTIENGVVVTATS
ncbi:fibrous sheath CABYR-binding protein-like [Poecilia formosa]|uniref:fibrous sheath CABYR-binding protein-like n=1 Tax=Poecilia formosa TaxID=48698 RepID=UPI0004447AEC|nr:PREDICTED: fibrous sheath CABYR-binding protein-like [Poecilia formosa]